MITPRYGDEPMSLSHRPDLWTRLFHRKARPITRRPARSSLRVAILEDRVGPDINPGTLFNGVGSRLQDLGRALYNPDAQNDPSRKSILQQADSVSLPIINRPLSDVAQEAGAAATGLGTQ